MAQQEIDGRASKAVHVTEFDARGLPRSGGCRTWVRL